MITKLKKLKQVTQKMILGLSSAFIIMSGLTIETNALTGTTGSIVYPEWKLTSPTTGATDGVEGYLMVNNEPVFCVDYFTDFHKNKTVTQGSFSDIGISVDKAKRLSLIAYYGTKVAGRTGRDWYAITQSLLWREIHGRTDLNFVSTNTAPNLAAITNCWNAILNDVNRYYTMPSFSSSNHTVDADGSIELNDTNGVLSDMVVKSSGDLNVSISGNKLVIQGNADASDETTIVLRKNIAASETGTSIVYTAKDCQSMASFKVSDPVQVAFKVKTNKFGQFELVKYNEDKTGTVPDTSYRITGPNGFDQTLKTDSEGKIKLDRLPIGDYKAVEVQAGTGYLIDTTEFSFTVKNKETTIIDPTNLEPTGKIELNKTIDSSDTNNLVGDAVIEGNSYTLYAKEKITNKSGTKTFYQKDEAISTVKTDSNGKVSWDNLPLGSYYVKETKTNDTLQLNTSIINIEIEYQGQTVQKVIKTENTSDKVNMQRIQVFKSGEKDSISGFIKGLQGAQFTFKLLSEVNHVGWDNATTYAVITTDKDGYASTPYLPYGEYVVKETKTPADYITAPDFTISVTQNYSEYKDVEQVKKVNINNRPFTSQLKIVKKDALTNEVVTLNSASFKIKNSNGEYVVQKVGGKKYDSFTTNSKNNKVVAKGTNGEVVLPLELDAGEYTIEEVEVPEGFLELDAPVNFKITNQYDYDKDEDETPILTVEITNEQPFGKIVLTKTDKVTGDPLENIEYELTAKENIYSAVDGSLRYAKGATVSKRKTNADGKIIIEHLFMGKYEFKETLTNEGYVLSSKVHDIELKQSDTTTKEYVIEVNVTNIAPTGEIDISKSDKETGKLLSGVQYQLTAAGNIYSLDGRNTLLYSKGDVVSMNNSENGYYVTNELGKIHIEGLPLGKYELKETSALDGYVKDYQVYSIDLSYDGSDKTVYAKSLDLTNIQTTVELSKKDVTTGNELLGASMTLLDSEGKVIESWTSGNEPHIIRGLTVGQSYILREDLAPLGYVKSSDITFTVEDNDKVQKVEMIDEIIKVQISKQDLTTGKELPGAKLQIIDKDNKVVHEWISSNDPHLFEKLPAGEYILREITAPDGYEIAEDVSFTVKETSEIQKVVMKDKPIVKVVATGDTTKVMPYVMISLGALIGIIGILHYRKKKDNEI